MSAHAPVNNNRLTSTAGGRIIDDSSSNNNSINNNSVSSSQSGGSRRWTPPRPPSHASSSTNYGTVTGTVTGTTTTNSNNGNNNNRSHPSPTMSKHVSSWNPPSGSSYGATTTMSATTATASNSHTNKSHQNRTHHHQHHQHHRRIRSDDGTGGGNLNLNNNNNQYAKQQQQQQAQSDANQHQRRRIPSRLTPLDGQQQQQHRRHHTSLSCDSGTMMTSNLLASFPGVGGNDSVGWIGNRPYFHHPTGTSASSALNWDRLHQYQSMANSNQNQQHLKQHKRNPSHGSNASSNQGDNSLSSYQTDQKQAQDVEAATTAQEEMPWWYRLYDNMTSSTTNNPSMTFHWFRPQDGGNLHYPSAASYSDDDLSIPATSTPTCQFIRRCWNSCLGTYGSFSPSCCVWCGIRLRTRSNVVEGAQERATVAARRALEKRGSTSSTMETSLVLPARRWSCPALFVSIMAWAFLWSASTLHQEWIMNLGETRSVRSPLLFVKQIQVSAVSTTMESFDAMVSVYHWPDHSCPPLTGPTLTLDVQEAVNLKINDYQYHHFYLNAGSTIQVDASPLEGSSSIYLLQGEDLLQRVQGDSADENFQKVALKTCNLEATTSTTLDTLLLSSSSTTTIMPQPQQIQWEYEVGENDIYILVYGNSISQDSRLFVNYHLEMTTYNLSDTAADPVCANVTRNEPCLLQGISSKDCILVQSASSSFGLTVNADGEENHHFTSDLDDDTAVDDLITLRLQGKPYWWKLIFLSALPILFGWIHDFFCCHNQDGGAVSLPSSSMRAINVPFTKIPTSLESSYSSTASGSGRTRSQRISQQRQQQQQVPQAPPQSPNLPSAVISNNSPPDIGSTMTTVREEEEDDDGDDDDPNDDHDHYSHHDNDGDDDKGLDSGKGRVIVIGTRLLLDPVSTVFHWQQEEAVTGTMTEKQQDGHRHQQSSWLLSNKHQQS